MAENLLNQSDCRSLERINHLDFLRGDKHQRKAVFETTTFGWVWPVVPLIQSDYRILLSSVYREGINQSLRFFVWR